MHEKQNCSEARKQIPLKAKKKQFGQIKSEKADSTTTRKEEKADDGEESSAEEDDVLDAIAEWQEV